MKLSALLSAITLGLLAVAAQSVEEKPGIMVVVDHFDSRETVDTKLMTGHSGYDLVLTSGQHLSRAISSGAL